MRTQFGPTGMPPQVSFLRGGIAARYLPSADQTAFPVRRSTPVRVAGTVDYTCSANPHIPACQAPTTNCTGDPTNDCPPGTGSFCPTREFVC